MDEPDLPDIIAGALQTSRAHAWELMREAVAAEDAPSLSASDAKYWLRHRAAILTAIRAAGFSLMSNKRGFWLQKMRIDATIPAQDTP